MYECERDCKIVRRTTTKRKIFSFAVSFLSFFAEFIFFFCLSRNLFLSFAVGRFLCGILWTASDWRERAYAPASRHATNPIIKLWKVDDYATRETRDVVHRHWRQARVKEYVWSVCVCVVSRIPFSVYCVCWVLDTVLICYTLIANRDRHT